MPNLHAYGGKPWAHRVQQLEVGVSGPEPDNLTVDALTQALQLCLQPGITTRAHELAGRMELHGARLAAERLIKEFDRRKEAGS